MRGKSGVQAPEELTIVVFRTRFRLVYTSVITQSCMNSSLSQSHFEALFAAAMSGALKRVCNSRLNAARHRNCIRRSVQQDHNSMERTHVAIVSLLVRKV